MAAHVDAGKTTLSEALLFRAGGIRKLGRVDNGDAFLDNDPMERSRGITIFSKQAILRINDTEITLLDTPGHVDFSAEAERAFTVPDCAILVISGTDGVQSHTHTLWELLGRFGIPTFVFVNKMDISHKSKVEILGDLHKLDKRFADFSENVEEQCAEFDEDCMNALLERGGVPMKLIAAAVSRRNVFPVCFGAALRSEGADMLLELLERYAEPQERYGDFAALVYKITSDENGVRLTHMKINGGELKNRAIIATSEESAGEKVTQIRLYNGAKFTAVDSAVAGQLVAVAGLSGTYAGQALGVQKNTAAPVIEPVLNCKVELPPGADVQQVLPKLKKLEEEDPQLRFSWSEQLREIHVLVMGEVQLEILQKMIAERFGLSVSFGEGSIAYRETIAEKVEGVGHYEPLRHYAEVHVLIEPLPRGSGVVFARDCRNLDENWQRLALSNLRERRHLGVLTGSPITDVKITLAAGRAHLKHTEGGDFRQAAWRAVRQGLASARSVLLEPFCRFRLEIPLANVGRAMSDLQQMGAEFAQPSGSGEFSVIEGKCPISEMRSYQKNVIDYTRGTGRLSVIFDGYCPCHNAQEVIEKIGYNFENDVENTADSVFCSHGAGYLVKWNEVPSKMHIPSVLCEQTHKSVTQAEISSYKQRIATDKELMEIFERTYGKIKRGERTAMRRDKTIEKTPKLPPPKRGPEFLLVDGYNIIFSWEELARIAKDNLDLARSQLINIMCNYQGFKKCNLILVFDAYKVRSDREVEQYGNVSVVYTREAETADMYIEKTAHKLSAENRVRVATSDGTEQLIILGAGAVRVSAKEFKMEVDEVERAIREILDSMH